MNENNKQSLKDWGKVILLTIWALAAIATSAAAFNLETASAIKDGFLVAVGVLNLFGAGFGIYREARR